MRSLRMAIRALRATPVVSHIVVLTMALGMGANTAIFSVVNSLLLRTLPVPEPGRLVTISSDYALAHGFKAGAGWNYEMWTRLQQIPSPFDGVLMWSQPTFDFARSGEKEPARTLLVSGSFFSTLGVHARVGRLLTAEDDVRGGGKDGAVVVISHRLWQERFGGSAATIGTRLTLDGAPFTIVGVTPPEFLGIEVGLPFDVAVPLGTEPLILGKRSSIDERRSFTFAVLVRLKPEQSLDAATAVLRSIQPHVLGVTADRMADVRPTFLSEPFVAVPAPTGTSDFSRLRGQYQRPLLTLLALVTLVLLIACVNVASVLLARATARRHEIGVRLALGATRRQLIPQLMVESLLLSAAGAALGLLLAAWGSRALVAQLSSLDTEVLFNLTPDWRVLGFTGAISAATAVLFGTAPALRATSVHPISALRGSGGSRGASETSSRLTSGLVVLQIALSLMLVVAAGLFIQTFGRLLSVPLGFDSDRVLIASVDTARARVDPADRLAFYERLAEAVRNVPGIQHAAASMDTPLSRARQAPLLLKAERVESVVAPDWFATYGTHLVAGRDFTAQDSAGAPRVAVVNQAFARKFFPDKNALGEVMEGRTIVGLVGDAVFATVRAGTRPTVYIPLAQSAWTGPPRTVVNISIRAAAGPPALLARTVSAALTAVDPDLAFSFRPLQEYVDASVSQERLLARLAGLFGGLALLLAGLGLYGVTSYAVSRRQFEIGIRMALGAERAHVLSLVLARSLAITAAGVFLGLTASAVTTRYLEAMLYGVVPLDMLTFAAFAFAFVVVAATAAFIPARRATRIDPLVALRSE